MLCGSETMENAEKYRVNKMFFSTAAISSDGFIASGIYYDILLKTVAKKAKEVFYLVDHKKIDKDFCEIYGSFSDVDFVISDYKFSDDTVEKYKNTKFVFVESDLK